MMTKDEAKQRHPAGKQYIPKVPILERLLMVMSENHWLYGYPTSDAPNRLERWDLRSMLDYAVITYQPKPGGKPTNYGTFYLWRNATMESIMRMAEIPNYGEWRFWETDKSRTQMDLERVVRAALEAERSFAKVTT